MKLKQFIKELQCLRSELQEKEVAVRAENGLLFTPHAKMLLKENVSPLNFDMEDVDKVLITYNNF